MWKNKRPDNWVNPHPDKVDSDYHQRIYHRVYEAGANAMFKEFGKLDIVEILKILAEYFPDRYVRLGEDNDK